MKTNMLPRINSFAIKGVIMDSVKNENNKVSFRLVHFYGSRNEEGKNESISLFMNMTLKKGQELPSALRKGATVICSGYLTGYKDKDGHFKKSFNVTSIDSVENANDVTIAGRLVADAEYNETNTVANFSVFRKTSADKDRTVFINLVMFSKDGAFPVNLLKKGSAVEVSAYLQPNVYTKDGKTVYGIDYVVKDIKAAKTIVKEIPDEDTVEGATPEEEAAETQE